MKVLLAGVNSYVGMRLIPVLLEKGHDVVCLVRDKKRFHKHSDFGNRVTLITGDLLRNQSIEAFPANIDAAYYLVHSMAQTLDFAALEALSAYNFIHALDKTDCRQTIFLSNILNTEKPSKYLESCKHVEDVLKEGKAPLTVLRAGIIIGQDSAALGVIQTLVEKSPIITVPRWVNTYCQPIAIQDVLGYLEHVMLNPKTYNHSFDIGGPDILTFKDMILIYAKARHLKRHIVTIPFLSASISSYWLHWLTAISHIQAADLVNSIKNETIMHNHAIDDAVPRQCLTYEEALQLAIIKIEQPPITTKWQDAFNIG
jgi:uncharacterized protein YbjT (DUF2867 family)